MQDRGALSATRRGFLALSGSAAALATLARLPIAAASQAPQGPRFFGEPEREILTQVVERMVDTGQAAAPAVRETRAIDVIDGLCGNLDPEIVEPLPLLLRAVDWGPWLFEWRPARFTRATDAEKDASLRGWMTSRWPLRRLGFAALRNLSFVGYWSQEATWPLLGYQGPLLRREGAS